MVPYWFTALTMKSVGRAAKSMVLEVDRQFTLATVSPTGSEVVVSKTEVENAAAIFANTYKVSAATVKVCLPPRPQHSNCSFGEWNS